MFQYLILCWKRGSNDVINVLQAKSVVKQQCTCKPAPGILMDREPGILHSMVEDGFVNAGSQIAL